MDRITPRDTFWACVFGALAYGVLYLIGIVVLALHWRAPWGIAALAVIAAGVTYLSFFLQMMGLGSVPYRVISLVLILLTIVLGAASGLWLLAFMIATGG